MRIFYLLAMMPGILLSGSGAFASAEGGEDERLWREPQDQSPAVTGEQMDLGVDWWVALIVVVVISVGTFLVVRWLRNSDVFT